MAGTKLEQIIFSRYARSALFPILTIELLLLILYFGINSYSNWRTEETLKREVTDVIPHLSTKQADGIHTIFSQISKETKYFADAHAHLYSYPDAYGVAGEAPVLSKAPNGTLYQSNLKEGSSLYISLNAPFDERQLLFAKKTASLNLLYQHVVKNVPNVVAAYMNTPDNMNRLYPFIPDVFQQYPATLNMADYNFFYLADSVHNPKRNAVWTGVYLDPAGQGWMLSCVAPVYSKERFEGVVGLDVTIQKIVDNVLKTALPWNASAFLVDDSAMILAMPERVESLLGLKELKSHVYNQAISKEQQKPQDYNLFANHDKQVAAEFRKVFSSKSKLHEINLRGRDVYLAQSVIEETGWRLMVLVERDEVLATVNEQATLSKRIGFAMIAAMILFYLTFFFFLRNKAHRMAQEIAHPVEELTKATATMGTGSVQALGQCGIDEIDNLTNHFNTMAVELEQRSKELVASRVEAEVRTKDAELAYAKGLYESASGYLHNVGNAITRLDSAIMDVQAVTDSTSQYPEVFQKIKGGDQGMLERFEDILLHRTIPRLQASLQSIITTKTSIQKTITYQQATFVQNQNGHVPEIIHVADTIQSILSHYQDRADERRITIRTDLRSSVQIRNHKLPLLQGIENLIKNALESSQEGGLIQVSCDVVNERVRIVVKDNGKGISAEDLSKVKQAGFSTKQDGHGLGLHSLAVFLSAYNGSVTLESEGLGKGATATIEVGNVE